MGVPDVCCCNGELIQILTLKLGFPPCILVTCNVHLNRKAKHPRFLPNLHPIYNTSLFIIVHTRWHIIYSFNKTVMKPKNSYCNYSILEPKQCGQPIMASQKVSDKWVNEQNTSNISLPESSLAEMAYSNSPKSGPRKHHVKNWPVNVFSEPESFCAPCLPSPLEPPEHQGCWQCSASAKILLTLGQMQSP